MSFFATVDHYRELDSDRFLAQVTDADVERVLGKDKPGAMDFLTLLSHRAAGHLEAMARRAHQLTVQHFGRTIQMFIPLYISNHCTNHCAYCGFNHNNPILRRKLSLEEIETEARAIAATGMQHILFLTGEAPRFTPMQYLEEAARLLKRHFASVAIEVYPLEVEEYRRLRQAGVDGMTLFQETYDQAVYKRVHPAGRKRDYHWRLNAPERAAKGGMRAVNIGPLLGLAEPRREMFFTGLHARYLENSYLETEVAISLPRFNAAEGNFLPDFRVDDKTFVQFLTALRIFLPRAGLTISTRESATFRDRILPLGATRYSAGSSTGVGGYTEIRVEQTPQFEITDDRSVDEVAAAIVARGYQPVYKDWDLIG
ncbi:MAG: 2-iminoacetate synthase ThiH [Desulfobulbus sp.]|jgi:2-iminoacetate synthase|uniref:2-iminoacetate synthase ThiH n=1 Tax=Desulfobulbus sp. TaxID=895 RepID=UPI0028466BED|nr:2-iminoacetate synthase ThiH [Desulfobulbus sp.]MDR2549088.1 2-iminoacetate synthase ThiH [Desulfobulbus sp.]